MSGHHAENRLGSLRVGLIVLVVALVTGYLTAQWRHRGDEDAPTVELARPAMGTLVQIRVVPIDGADGNARTAAALKTAMTLVAQIDSLLTDDLPRPAGLPLNRQAEIRHELLELGVEALRQTGGAFDPRLRRLIAVWGFGEMGSGVPHVPGDDEIAAALAELGDRLPTAAADLETRPQLLYFGAWAKGYAVDRAIEVLRRAGVPAALINAGGEIRGYGRDWTVGVQHPRLPGALLATLRPGERAVATSGDYEQFFEQDGERFHHLLDPRTGQPARGCRSVTIVAADCARADALATGVFVLGPDEGLTLVEQLPGVEALIVDRDGQRRDSSGLEALLAAD